MKTQHEVNENKVANEEIEEFEAAIEEFASKCDFLTPKNTNFAQGTIGATFSAVSLGNSKSSGKSILNIVKIEKAEKSKKP